MDLCETRKHTRPRYASACAWHFSPNLHIPPHGHIPSVLVACQWMEWGRGGEGQEKAALLKGNDRVKDYPECKVCLNKDCL